MQFTELGNRDGKTLLLLPGTACTWQLNFKNVLDALSERYHVIAVNYDGFEGDPNVVFTDMLTVTEKIEDYIRKHHGARMAPRSAATSSGFWTKESASGSITRSSARPISIRAES